VEGCIDNVEEGKKIIRIRSGQVSNMPLTTQKRRGIRTLELEDSKRRASSSPTDRIGEKKKKGGKKGEGASG